MSATTDVINHTVLRHLLTAGAPVGAEAVAGEDGWRVIIHYERARRTLVATRGMPKTFRQFETLAGYLKDLGIVEYRVNASGFGVTPRTARTPDRRSTLASERMKRAHLAAAHDTWFRAQVQASIDDPAPSIDDAQARHRMAARRQALLDQPLAKSTS